MSDEVHVRIREQFDLQWELQNLEAQIANCPRYALFPVFERILQPGDRILESGCGIGRWVLFFHRRGYDIVGIDWSPTTVDLLRSYDPTVQVLVDDARSSQFGDSSFDVILSLGTIEHALEGPADALRDYFRLLKPGGRLVVTVPVLSIARRLKYAVTRPVQLARSFLLSRGRDEQSTLQLLLERALPGLYVNAFRDSTGYHFFEYRFSEGRLAAELRDQGFEIQEMFTAFYEDGILDTLGKIAGTWDHQEGRLVPSVLGKMLLSTMPQAFPHMAAAVARKPR
jgi:SAM-dependent methyltransferase